MRKFQPALTKRLSRRFHRSFQRAIHRGAYPLDTRQVGRQRLAAGVLAFLLCFRSRIPGAASRLVTLMHRIQAQIAGLALGIGLGRSPIETVVGRVLR
jgi:hypothetical protein